MAKKLILCLLACGLLVVACEGDSGNGRPRPDVPLPLDVAADSGGTDPDLVIIPELPPQPDEVTPGPDVQDVQQAFDAGDGEEDIPPVLCSEENPCPAPVDLCQEVACVEGECLYTDKICGPANPEPCDIHYCEPETGECAVCEGCNPECAEPHPCVADPDRCDDGDPCTDDLCDAQSGCYYQGNTAPCDDGNACTQGDTCGPDPAGRLTAVCLPGAPISCNDGDPCTEDMCVPARGCVYFQIPASLCQTGLRCPGGGDTECPLLADPCTRYACNQDTKLCERVNAAGPCDDGNACTQGDTCQDGWCVPGEPLACDDGNPCTQDGCVPDAGCRHTLNEPCVIPCDSSLDCAASATGETGNPCLRMRCVQGACVQVVSEGNLCSTGDPCVTGARCTDGLCVGGFPATCRDGDVCTADGCDSSAGGCVFQAYREDCTPAQCSAPDDCLPAAGEQPLSPLARNICYTPQCAIDGPERSACYYRSPSRPCACAGPMDAASCDDGDACTIDACVANTDEERPNPPFVCKSTFNGDLCCARPCVDDSVCNDSNKCTADTCVTAPGASSGCCLSTWLPAPTCLRCDDDGDCDDGDPRTVDICGPDRTCNAPIAADCGDFPCAADADCAAYPEMIDTNPCTDALCVGCGCELVPNTLPCDDGDACTESDQCQQGACAGNPVTCPEHPNPECYESFCDTGTGCGFRWAPSAGCTLSCLQDPAVCDDGDPCTTDTCSPQGECLHTGPNQPGGLVACLPLACSSAAECDDGNPCTQDACRLQIGGQAVPIAERVCLYAPLPGCTSPAGLACTASEDCRPPRACQAGSDEACCVGDDDGTRTTIVCEATIGCRWLPREECVGECRVATQALDCNDGDPCTRDLCDPATWLCDNSQSNWVQAGNLYSTCVPCDGDSPCPDLGEPCVSVACVPNAEISPLDAPGTGTCLARVDDELYPDDCEDFDPCTIDFCGPDGCVHTPSEPPCPQCAQDADCDDGDSCTTDICLPDTSQCQNVLDSEGCVSCTNHEDCLTTGCDFEFCEEGRCVAAVEEGQLCVEVACTGSLDCDDGDPTTDDVCLPDFGVCLWVPFESPPSCDEDEDCESPFRPCEVLLGCDSGQCVYAEQNPCEAPTCSSNADCPGFQGEGYCNNPTCLGANSTNRCLAGHLFTECCAAPEDCAPPEWSPAGSAALVRDCDAFGWCHATPYPAELLTGDTCESSAECRDRCLPGEPDCGLMCPLSLGTCVDWPCAEAYCTLEGRCVHLRADCGHCTNDLYCMDADPCTTDTCVGGSCVHTPIAGCAVTPCGPGNACHSTDPCLAGLCVPELGCLWFPSGACD